MSTEKGRGGTEKIDTPVAAEKKWWASNGFYTSFILFFAGAWGLNSLDFDAAVKTAVLQVYAFVGSAGALRAFIVTAKFDIKKWLGQIRTYEYLIAALTGIIPNIPADAGSKLYDLAMAIKTGNIGIIISQIITFAVFAYNIWLNRDKEVAVKA